MPTRVFSVEKPEIKAFLMPSRFKHDIIYFATPAGKPGVPPALGQGDWWIPREEALRLFEEGVVRIVSPLDSSTTAELEITEEQEAWLQWVIENEIEQIRLQ
jgi:hypothetical protein